MGKGSNFSRMPCKAVRIESFFFLVCIKTKDTKPASPTSTNCTETIPAFLDYRQEKNGLLAPCCLLECTESIAVAQCMLYIHWRPRGREGVHIPHMVTVTQKMLLEFCLLVLHKTDFSKSFLDELLPLTAQLPCY